MRNPITKFGRSLRRNHARTIGFMGVPAAFAVMIGAAGSTPLGAIALVAGFASGAGWVFDRINNHYAPRLEERFKQRFSGNPKDVLAVSNLYDLIAKKLKTVYGPTPSASVQHAIARHIADVVPSLKRLTISRKEKALPWAQVSFTHIYEDENGQEKKTKFTVSEALEFLRGEQQKLIHADAPRARNIAAPQDSTIGKVMENGTVYAGVVPSTGKALYILSEDENVSAGKFHNITKSFNASVKQALRASGLSGNLSLRVPTPEELDVMYLNRDKIGGFNVERAEGAEVYWAQDNIEGGLLTAPARRFTDGAEINLLKVKKASARLVVAR